MFTGWGKPYYRIPEWTKVDEHLSTTMHLLAYGLTITMDSQHYNGITEDPTIHTTRSSWQTPLITIMYYKIIMADTIDNYSVSSGRGLYQAKIRKNNEILHWLGQTNHTLQGMK